MSSSCQPERASATKQAQTSFERAVEVHRQVQDVLGEATDVYRLRYVHLRRDKLDEG